MSTILKSESLSKQYRIGTIGNGTLSDDLKRWWYKARGKTDPFLQVGAVNNRRETAKEDYVWALKDINFEVQEGEILGIIGKNGAGKSTLLKILSRVTLPTLGSIKSKGRIASLLEVGTGFHGELTGRENIFMNGAVLGMTKNEIKRKFDEIVDFSGCEKYIDTPVKRYSSGMTIRLGFAVAAHLEPEILVVDEVLAVGDADFQKKAIGKMHDLSSGTGSTVLFVSHNMNSIKKLTSRCLMLEDGQLSLMGETDEVIRKYISESIKIKTSQEWILPTAPGNEFAKLKRISVLDETFTEKHGYSATEDIFIRIEYWDKSQLYTNTAIIQVLNEYDDIIFASNEFNSPKWKENHKVNGMIIATCKIPRNFLAEGNYKVLIAVGTYNPNVLHIKLDDALSFMVFDPINSDLTARGNTSVKWPGIVRPLLEWDVRRE